ncbi:MAG: hypothetical protein AB1547_02675 [Thermodesulfobacteriota bacterium]
MEYRIAELQHDVFKQILMKHLRPIQRYPAASNTFSQQSQKASPATPLMPDIYEKHGKIDFLRLHHFCLTWIYERNIKEGFD